MKTVKLPSFHRNVNLKISVILTFYVLSFWKETENYFTESSERESLHTEEGQNYQFILEIKTAGFL